MDKQKDISNHPKDKLASGLMRVGLAAGLAAASLGGVPTASATCIGISGLNTPGCSSTFGNFSLVLGEGIASSSGNLTSAIAIGLSGPAAATSVGALSLAVAISTSGDGDTAAATEGISSLAYVQGSKALGIAGNNPTDFGNVAINFGQGLATQTAASNLVIAGGAASPSNSFNLAANLGGNSTNPAHGSNLQAVGFANSALNFFGDNNFNTALGAVNNSTSVFGSNNTLSATGGTGLTDLGFNVAGSLFTDDATVQSGGPESPLDINVAPFNTPASTNVLAATTSLGGSVRKSVSDPIRTSTKKFNDNVKKFNDNVKKFNDNVKKFNDNVSRVIGGLAGGAKAGTAGTGSSSSGTGGSSSGTGGSSSGSGGSSNDGSGGSSNDGSSNDVK